MLVGPSGSGKTTVLRLTAGLEELTDGEIRIGGRVVNDIHPMDRDIAMVFQNYALYPHMTVAENIGFGLKLRGVKKRDVAERVQRTAETLGLSELLEAQAGAALGRPAAARRDGPGDRARPGGVPDGRAALEPRREAARADAHGDPAPAARARHDDDVRHARPGRGDDDGRPGGRHARRTPASRSTRRRRSTTGRPTCSSRASSARPAMNFLRAQLEASNGTLVASFGSHTLELPARRLPPALARGRARRDHRRTPGASRPGGERPNGRSCARRSRWPSPSARR